MKTCHKNGLSLFESIKFQVGLFSCVSHEKVEAELDHMTAVVWDFLESFGFHIRYKHQEARHWSCKMFSRWTDKYSVWLFPSLSFLQWLAIYNKNASCLSLTSFYMLLFVVLKDGAQEEKKLERHDMYNYWA